MEKFTIYTDGGSRGNPGPAAIGLIVFKNNTIVAERGFVIGTATNNLAEYPALKKAIYFFLNYVKEQEIDPPYAVDFLLDSSLVVNQVLGRYKINSETLRKFVFDIRALVDKNLIKANFKHIPRKKNTRADMWVNKALDENIFE